MGSAAFAYVLADALGIPNPVWASISGIVVSQGQLRETRSSVIGRVLGTLFGAAVATLTHYALQPLTANMALHIALSVGIASLIAHKYRGGYVGMFTCPIVLLTALPGVPTYMIGFYRASEVIVGVLVAGVLHMGADRLLAAIKYAEPENERKSVVPTGDE
jgi:uncharacterized membrane protein YccC